MGKAFAQAKDGSSAREAVVPIPTWLPDTPSDTLWVTSTEPHKTNIHGLSWPGTLKA